MDRWWWGKDEDVYLDEDGKPISKEDYYKQFKGGMINPFDKDGNLLPQFQTREPMEDDSMFQGRDRNQLDDWVENERRTTNPFYHLRGGDLDVDWDEVFGGPEYEEAKRKREEACKICRGEKSPDDVAIDYLRGGADGDDEMARRMAEYLAPHISQGIGQVADGIQDFLKSPEQREQEKRDKAELEEAERKKKEREEGSWSSYLSPFFHLQGGEMGDDGGMTLEEWNCHEGIGNCLQKDGTPIDRFYGYGKLDEMTVRQLIDYGKSLGVKGLDGKTKDVIIAKIEAGPKETKAKAKKVSAPVPVDEDMYAEEREHAYKLLIAQPLKVLKGMAEEFKITRILHKNKETLARELADKYVEQEVEEMEGNKKRNKGTWTGDTDPNGVPVIKMGHYIRRPKPHELAQGFADPPTAMEKQYSGKGNPVLPPQDALESKKDNPVVEEIIEEPMDDGDIRTYFPNAKIIRYSSLAKMSDIEQLLPRDKTYAFLLYEDSPGSGHWVVVLRYGTTIEFFCSYGSKIDGPLRWYNPKDNAMLGQSKPYLSLLLKKADKKFKAIHNAVPFQSSKHGVATCGAWDVMRVNQLVNHNQDLHEFQSYMEDVKKETGLTYDEIVANYVSKR